MSKAQNSERYQYEHSPIGKVQAYIRRFNNIADLRKAFDESDDFKKVDGMKVEMEKYVSDETEKFEVIEAKFREDKIRYEATVNDKLVSTLTEIANILKEFEKNYERKIL